MTGFFQQYLQMALAGSLVLLVLLFARLLLKRMPKRFMCFLWMIALFRLLCPYTIEGPVPKFWEREASIEDAGQADTEGVVQRPVTVREPYREQQMGQDWRPGDVMQGDNFKHPKVFPGEYQSVCKYGNCGGECPIVFDEYIKGPHQYDTGPADGAFCTWRPVTAYGRKRAWSGYRKKSGGAAECPNLAGCGRGFVQGFYGVSDSDGRKNRLPKGGVGKRIINTYLRYSGFPAAAVSFG